MRRNEIFYNDVNAQCFNCRNVFRILCDWCDFEISDAAITTKIWNCWELRTFLNELKILYSFLMISMSHCRTRDANKIRGKFRKFWKFIFQHFSKLSTTFYNYGFTKWQCSEMILEEFLVVLCTYQNCILETIRTNMVKEASLV